MSHPATRGLRAITAALVIVACSVAPARADVFACGVDLNAGQFAVRKIVNPVAQGMLFNGTYTYGQELHASTPANYHLFSGFWLLRASDFMMMSHGFFDYASSTSPPGVSVASSGQIVSNSVPAPNLPLDGLQGHSGYGNHLDAGTYYFVSFGEGAGSFHWEVDFGLGDPPTCDPVDVPGQIVRYNALDFQGGTQVVAPGYGYAQNAKLSFTNPFSYSIGAMFCYEPSPFPAADCPVTADGVRGGIRQTLETIGGTWHQWDVTANYEGKTDTILMELLELDLAPTG